MSASLTARPAVPQDTTTRRVDGQIVTGTREGTRPVAGQWVVLHRVGQDRAGPIDSMQTTANGRYHFAFRASGDTSALYFASTTYGGVAYFTSPLRGDIVRGDDAAITVFDTTSGPVGIRVNAIHPTSVKTAMVDNVDHARRMLKRDDATIADLEEVYRGRHALPVAWLDPEDIANAVLWLMSEEARYVTGNTLAIDAGYLVR